MKTTQTLLLAATLSAGLLAATGANATLVAALSGQVVNDTDLNITWLTNANLAATENFSVSGIDENGGMTWSTAQAWIAGMNGYNVVGYLGYNNWRLPTTQQPDASCSYQSGGDSYGYNCTGGEMGHLFNELGVPQATPIPATHNANLALFQNVQSYYWSGTGIKGDSLDVDKMFTLAVRPGQVAAVPVPAAAWLLGSGLLGLIGVARRKTA